MQNLTAVQSSDLEALRARLSERETCPRCGEDDPWQRCRDAD